MDENIPRSFDAAGHLRSRTNGVGADASQARRTGLPIGPYLGAAYSTYQHRWLPLAGLNVNFTRNLSGTVIFDGVRVHPLLNYTQGRHAFSFILAFANKPGASYSISF